MAPKGTASIEPAVGPLGYDQKRFDGGLMPEWRVTSLSMPEQSLGEISNEIQRLLQQAVLRCYPNAERRGCPGETVLRSVSRRHLPIRDAYWEHVTHCSPCFQEFLEFRIDLTTSRKRFRCCEIGFLGTAFAGRS